MKKLFYINMKIISAIFIICCSLVISGCAKKVVPLPVSNAVAFNLTENQVKEAIFSVASQRGYKISNVEPNKIELTLDVRTHKLILNINYTNTSYQISYKDSNNLDYDGRKIHRRYKTWVNNLDSDIQIELSKVANK